MSPSQKPRTFRPSFLLLLVLAVLPASAARGQEPDSLTPPITPAPDTTATDSIARPDTAGAGPPPIPGIPGERAPRGYEVDLHGIQGFDIGHLNRVDGLTPSFGLSLLSVRPNVLPTLEAEIALRTSRTETPAYRVAATQIFAGLDRFRMALEVYDETATSDAWKVGERENDVWVFLVREDLRNYYAARGARLSLTTSDLRAWSAALRLVAESNRSLDTESFFTLTTIFGDDAAFRPNPPVAEARLTSATLELRLHTAATQSPSLRVPGWNLAAAVERAGSALEGELAFTRGTLHLRRYNRLGERYWLNLRLFATGPLGDTRALPPQRFTYLGGAGSLPGFEPLEIAGDRAVLASAEIDVQLPNTSWSAPVFLLWQLELFSNAGHAVFRDDRSRLLSDLHWDAGAGVSGITVLGYLGVFAAQRLSHLDEPSSGPRVFFRLQRTF